MSKSDMLRTVIPHNPQASLHAVANIWERFIGTGELNDNRLRPVIADSWLRSRELGINPLNNRARSVISDEEIDAKLHSENLGISGKNVMDRMSDTVKDTGHVIVLADNSGRIIYSVGHNQVRNHLEKINFRPGSEWHEDTVGPNGVGTPLTLGQPELIMGSEHYCQGWQPWVCYGAPIHNPSDQSVLGCIDITGPANKVCVEAMALAISITQSIESDLSVTQLRKREELRLAFHDMQTKWPNYASMVVDDYGIIIDINSHATTISNTAPSILNKSISILSPELTTAINECIDEEVEKEYEIEMEHALISDARLIIKPIKTKKGASGCFVMILDKECKINPSSGLRSNEDELIRKTLLQTNGNISKAARILGIDRATIYRRRKNWQN
jgi:sigma-54 dependent transcriptional regulator, acetoin dehydrogenase operon transcriptional activator AcoR